MKQIDHDPNEFKDKRAGWPSTWLVVALGWAGYLYFHPFDWWSIAIGGGTGAIVVAWAMDLTGGKVPASWRSKPPRSG
jgi:hypothetical protein